MSEYGFDGTDIDFESPSLSIDHGDTGLQHPTTPWIVKLIAALPQLHAHFGPGLTISLVPEGTQIPAGYPSYGAQFGSYLPIGAMFCAINARRRAESFQRDRAAVPRLSNDEIQITA